ncbi:MULTISPECIES: hypothetical protein [Collinsella]|uniref:Uncharacterized protein n=1 Tax=Collinsella ihumii TaxID=1720204 RepID=A0ABT7XFQ3_9ACTN|nr:MULTISPECIES: hypothetical protein [Collinsella]MDN0055652.1 hypothetical protein [Collinsella ihumii]MDN0064234.1 hypothetical protein [Collinsella ihumii]OUO61530.1 hypothetical protein B5F74_05230 [Collinsella sp. An271]
MGNTRPVLVDAKQGIVDGTFYGFYQFADNGHAIPVAVIEFCDGQVGMIAPDRFRFADIRRPSSDGEEGGGNVDE